MVAVSDPRGPAQVAREEGRYVPAAAAANGRNPTGRPDPMPITVL